MSILIKGMEMPKNCGDCWFEHAYEFCKSKYEDCPLIEIHPHGDLIDRDKIAYFKDDSDLVDFCYAYRSQINSMPTIIPAEEEMK